jgi:hypothetical protein
MARRSMGRSISDADSGSLAKARCGGTRRTSVSGETCRYNGGTVRQKPPVAIRGRMTSARQSRCDGSWLRQAVLVAVPLTMLGLTSCAQVNALKSKVNGNSTRPRRYHPPRQTPASVRHYRSLRSSMSSSLAVTARASRICGNICCCTPATARHRACCANLRLIPDRRSVPVRAPMPCRLVIPTAPWLPAIWAIPDRF